MLSVTIFLLIVGVWISVSDFNINSFAENAEEDNKVQTASPFTTFGDDFLRLKEGFSDSMSGILSVFGRVNYQAEENLE